MTEREALWTTRQVAEYLHVSTRQVYELAKRGQLPAVRMPSARGQTGVLRFRPEDVEAWVEWCRANTPPAE